jgi:hypothetical protein
VVNIALQSLSIGMSVMGQKRHGLFVSYWGEAATGRGLISAGVATQAWKHRREHISGVNAGKFCVMTCRTCGMPCQLYLASRDKETTLDRILAFRAIRWVVVDSVKTSHVQGLITEAFALRLYRQELERVSAKCSVDPPFASAMGRNPADAWLVMRYTP